jgi:fibronectin-binding autotransporter adhesin
MKKLLAALMMFMIGSVANAQTTVNYGFENGNYTEWTVSNGSPTLRSSWSPNGAGSQVTTGMTNYCPGGGKCWTVTPYGSYMLAVQAGAGSVNFDPAMTSLGLQGSDISSIRSYLTSLGGNSTPTNASWVRRSVSLQAGVTYTFAWQYLSTDYVPFNDGSIITLTGGAGTPTLNGLTQNYALLGFTNPGTGNYSTNSYGATGWQVAVFTVPADGTYTLGFASFNLGDTSLSPILFIDQLQGSTSLNGAVFNPVQPNAGSAAPPPPAPAPTYPTVTVTANQTAKTNQTTGIATNSIYIQSFGSFNTVNIEQFSKFNAVRGINGAQSMLINGNTNTVTINQGTATTAIGNNLTEVSITGNSNTVSLTQQHNGKYAEVVLNGSSNQLSAIQNDVGKKTLFINALGNSNIINTLQQGTGNHFLDISAPYGTANINVTQSGAAQKLFQLIINNPGIGVSVTQNSASVVDSAIMTITCTTGPCSGYSYTKN